MKILSKFTRREFLCALGNLLGVSACSRLPSSITRAKIPGRIRGASFTTGHMLREKVSQPPISEEEVQVVIVGGGIAGLSAAWRFEKMGFHDFVLLELEEQVGGNSSSGTNDISSFPWGAHYIPLPSPNAQYVLELFRELKIIEGEDARGLPIYNEFYLCSAPRERLFIHGRWQDGTIPELGLSDSDRSQYDRFFALMNNFKKSIGHDGKLAFVIPIDDSSRDQKFLQYDTFSMADYLTREGFDSPYLRWYVNYCCRDDYGTAMESVSAWAGIHYFASRRGAAANAGEGALVTWPEGNGWIVNKLQSKLTAFLRCGSLVVNIEELGDKVLVDYYDRSAQKIKRIRASYVVYAAPRFTAPHVFSSLRKNRPAYIESFEYAPWMVANISLKSLPEDSFDGTAWDNVFYHSQSLGYISATHQNITQNDGRTVWTYYLPLSHTDPKIARAEALARSFEDWRELIINDLCVVHKDLATKVQNIDVWLWGHAMVRPVPGFIWGDARKQAEAKSGRIYFAHSDMSGISIFEEAQYRGVGAAEAILAEVTRLRGFEAKNEAMSG